MANKKLILDAGRQFPLVLMQAFTFENIADANVAVPVAKLPHGARVLRGQLITDAAFTAASTIKIGTATSDARFGTIDATAVGVDALTIPNDTVEETVIYAKPSVAMTQGSALLVMEYVIPDRANDTQP